MNKIHALEQDKLHSLGTNWNTVSGGYFSSPEVLESFWKSIETKLDIQNLPSHLHVGDFGGGNGNLSEYIKKKLTEYGKKVDLTLIDLQETTLLANISPETRKIHADIGSVKIPEQFDIILMRSVLQYLPYEEQKNILQNISDHLKKDGFFINQIAAHKTPEDVLAMEDFYKSSVGRIIYHHTPEQYMNELKEFPLETTYAGDALPFYQDEQTMIERFIPNNPVMIEKARKRFKDLIVCYSSKEWIEEQAQRSAVRVDYPIFISKKK